MARVLGLDLGERRIGLAISTPEGGLAVPLRILDVQGDDLDATEIAALAREEKVERLVLGHPVSLDGSAGPQAQRVEAFALLLESVSGLRVELCDERLSSAQARRATRATGKAERPVDDVAAAIILQSYLDRQRARSAE